MCRPSRDYLSLRPAFGLARLRLAAEQALAVISLRRGSTEYCLKLRFGGSESYDR